jgi:hypothetical protein
VLGAVLILLGLFIIGPILLFLVGAAWSALLGWLLAEDASSRAGEEAAATA